MRKLYIEQAVFKITDHYPILDQNGETVYQVDQDFTFLGHRVHLSTPDGNRIFTMERVFLSLLPKFEVCFYDGRPMAVIESEISFLMRKMGIYADGLALSLEGNFWDYEFTLSRDGQAVGEIDKEIFCLRDCFEITVWDESTEALLIAVMIAIDNLKDEN